MYEAVMSLRDSLEVHINFEPDTKHIRYYVFTEDIVGFQKILGDYKEQGEFTRIVRFESAQTPLFSDVKSRNTKAFTAFLLKWIGFAWIESSLMSELTHEDEIKVWEQFCNFIQ